MSLTLPAPGTCLCGCGKPTPLAKENRPSRGLVKGQPQRFVHGSHAQSPFRPDRPKWVVDENGCWLWTGLLDENGYAETNSVGARKAHRVLYIRLRGPIPGDLELDHTCNVRRCVNPDHLEPVTHAENVRRANERRHGGDS